MNHLNIYKENALDKQRGKMNIRETLKDKKRIVIKVGSSSLVHQETGELDFVNGYFLMIPELESYDKLLESLGV